MIAPSATVGLILLFAARVKTDAGTSVPDHKTELIKHDMNVNVVKYSISGIVIAFNLQPPQEYASYQIRYRKEDTSRWILINHMTPEAQYEISDLENGREYNICVASTIDSTVTYITCVDAHTLDIMQTSSIVGLTLTLGILTVVILCGWIYWRYRYVMHNKLKHNQDDDGEAEALTSGDNQENNTEGIMDETPKHKDLPHCSIEVSSTFL